MLPDCSQPSLKMLRIHISGEVEVCLVFRQVR
jgi:hypothetical protein